MEAGLISKSQDISVQENNAILGKLADRLVSTISSYLQVEENSYASCLCELSESSLSNMAFFRLHSCLINQTDDVALLLFQKMEKLFSAIHALNLTIAYGINSFAGNTDLIFGVSKDNCGEGVVRSLIEGLLSGIEISSYEVDVSHKMSTYKHGGLLTGVPVVEIEKEKQTFDISTLMRCLNGQNYTLLCLAKPSTTDSTMSLYGEAVSIRDSCFAFSKKNISTQKGTSDSTANTKATSISAGGGVLIFNCNTSRNTSEALTKATTENRSVSYDIQNGFALEMMEYCDTAIERFRKGMNVGMWHSAFVYRTDDAAASQIIKACLKSEVSKNAKDVFPPKSFDLENGLCFPNMVPGNKILASITSSELGFLCTLPFESVPDFELKTGKVFPMVASSEHGIAIGKVTDGNRPMNHMDFTLSENDLNKHTFVCGITGSGKTTTVKGILRNSKKPFLVIESAKKEYRNIVIPQSLDNDGNSQKESSKVEVYTLGKPEINSLQFNPFYVQCGINLQTHIDFLKDLFNASFSFYGPMPYILEKALQNIYLAKGWNLTLGYHPFLIDSSKKRRVFDSRFMAPRYALDAHRFLFPTMQDLKNEVERYIDEELKYDGEVAGNIKTAILARLESMCVGSKGFMLNTNSVLDMNTLLENNVVLELEGLPDDSDKAFCVGLLIIFVKEYRQAQAEKPEDVPGLKHLLVIEEAHRLLKNTETERTSENMGNPKGKAVEHFTNMIAEMRSYGQGVIIAEQIPTKLAPDVIKNSSNKIIQRVVSHDDQSVVASTIGLNSDDAIQLGTLKTGYALCHKEGMNLPVMVKISPIDEKSYSDNDIYQEHEDEVYAKINHSIIKELTSEIIDNCGLRLLNTILCQDEQSILQAIKVSKQLLAKHVDTYAKRTIMLADADSLFGDLLADCIMGLFANGVYRVTELVPDDVAKQMRSLFQTTMNETFDSSGQEINRIQFITQWLNRTGYKKNIRGHGVKAVSELVKNVYVPQKVDLFATIRGYFLLEDTALIEEISVIVKQGAGIL